jgi:hypothetical protein
MTFNVIQNTARSRRPVSLTGSHRRGAGCRHSFARGLGVAAGSVERGDGHVFMALQLRATRRTAVVRQWCQPALACLHRDTTQRVNGSPPSDWLLLFAKSPATVGCQRSAGIGPFKLVGLKLPVRPNRHTSRWLRCQAARVSEGRLPGERFEEHISRSCGLPLPRAQLASQRPAAPASSLTRGLLSRMCRRGAPEGGRGGLE